MLRCFPRTLRRGSETPGKPHYDWIVLSDVRAHRRSSGFLRSLVATPELAGSTGSSRCRTMALVQPPEDALRPFRIRVQAYDRTHLRFSLGVHSRAPRVCGSRSRDGARHDRRSAAPSRGSSVMTRQRKSLGLDQIEATNSPKSSSSPQKRVSPVWPELMGFQWCRWPVKYRPTAPRCPALLLPRENERCAALGSGPAAHRPRVGCGMASTVRPRPQPGRVVGIEREGPRAGRARLLASDEAIPRLRGFLGARGAQFD